MCGVDKYAATLGYIGQALDKYKKNNMKLNNSYILFQLYHY